jgi:hypothetical protein
VAPRILNKIVRLRNMLEHEFHLPKKTEVEDAVDVATLFLEALKPYTSGGAYMSSGWLADEDSANAWPIKKQGGLTYWRDSEGFRRRSESGTSKRIGNRIRLGSRRILAFREGL